MTLLNFNYNILKKLAKSNLNAAKLIVEQNSLVKYLNTFFKKNSIIIGYVISYIYKKNEMIEQY